MRRDLTDAFLRTVKPPKSGRIELRDGRVRGLVLRITAAGSATWSVRVLAAAAGKHTRISIGTYPALGIAAARKAALDAMAAVHRGRDPVAEKRAARAAREAARTAPTVAERFGEWCDMRETDPGRPWAERYAAEVRRIGKHDIAPKLGKRPLVETTRAEWVGLIEAKRKRAPGAAATLYRVASSFLNHAEAAGWIPHPLLPRKGAATLAPTMLPRERVLTDDELRDVWVAAEGEAAKHRAFARLLILTAARKSEVAGVAVGELDLDAGRWRIPAQRTKNRRALTLPLGSLAVAALRAVWPDDDQDQAYRLLGRYAGEGFAGFSWLKARLDAAIAKARQEQGRPEMAPWRWHDLRRTARTGMTRLGVPNDHAEAVLNHISGRSALERTYDRHDFAAEVIAASLRWQGHVASLVETKAAPVVALASRRR